MKNITSPLVITQHCFSPSELRMLHSALLSHRLSLYEEHIKAIECGFSGCQNLLDECDRVLLILRSLYNARIQGL